MVERDLEEVNGCLDHHRGEINHLKKREAELKEKEEELRGYVLRAAHEVEVFKSWLDQMEERVCRCGQTPSEVERSYPWRMMPGLNSPMLRLGQVSTSLPQWRIPSPSQFLLLAFLVGQLGPVLPWRR